MDRFNSLGRQLNSMRLIDHKSNDKTGIRHTSSGAVQSIILECNQQTSAGQVPIAERTASNRKGSTIAKLDFTSQPSTTGAGSAWVTGRYNSLDSRTEMHRRYLVIGQLDRHLAIHNPGRKYLKANRQASTASTGNAECRSSSRYSEIRQPW